MIDEFGLYPREEQFDPFSVMLFKGLQVVAFLFFLALLAISPEAKDGKIDTKAEFLVTMDWPDNHPDDLDLFVQDPAGNIAWYRHREAGFLVLDRDDRGGANDFIVVNGGSRASLALADLHRRDRFRRDPAVELWPRSPDDRFGPHLFVVADRADLCRSVAALSLAHDRRVARRRCRQAGGGSHRSGRHRIRLI